MPDAAPVGEHEVVVLGLLDVPPFVAERDVVGVEDRAPVLGRDGADLDADRQRAGRDVPQVRADHHVPVAQRLEAARRQRGEPLAVHRGGRHQPLHRGRHGGRDLERPGLAPVEQRRLQAVDRRIGLDHDPVVASALAHVVPRRAGVADDGTVALGDTDVGRRVAACEVGVALGQRLWRQVVAMPVAQRAGVDERGHARDVFRHAEPTDHDVVHAGILPRPVTIAQSDYAVRLRGAGTR